MQANKVNSNISRITSSRLGTAQKYGGLIRPSFYKILRNSIIQFINSLFSEASKFNTLHIIVSAFRILQLFGPSLACQIRSFWIPGSFYYKVMSIISIFFNLIPPEERDESMIYIFSIVLIFHFLFLVYLFICTAVFAKTACLPFWQIQFIVIVLSSVPYLCFPIIYELSGEIISKHAFILKPQTTTTIDTCNLVLSILNLVFSLIFVAIVLVPVLSTLFFRPVSLQGLIYHPQVIVILHTWAINFLYGFAANCERKQTLQGLLILFAGIVYFSSFANTFCLGGFLQPIIQNLMIVVSLMGVLNSLIVSIFIFRHKTGNISLLFISITGIVVLVIVTKILQKQYKIRNLKVLDKIEETGSIDSIKNINSLYTLAKHGMQTAHPVCLSFHFFQLALNKFPNNTLVWFLYAKCVAIFPENLQNLIWISQSIRSRKLHGLLARTIKTESVIIMRLREPNLPMELKIKINALLRDVTVAKQKVRHVWDLIIQGNTNEMENASKKAFKTVSECDTKFLRLFGQYPNNRYVVRQYARFCLEVKADYIEFVEMSEKSRFLNRGEFVTPDHANILGHQAFPELPKYNIQTYPRQNPVLYDNPSVAKSDVIDDTDDTYIDDERRLLIKRKIDELRIPAIFGSIIKRVVFIFAGFYIPAIAMIIFSNSFVNKLQQPLEFSYYLSELRTLSYQLGAFSLHHLLECCHPGQWLRMAKLPGINMSNLGGSYITKNNIIFLMNKASITLQELLKNQWLSSNDKIREPLNLVYGDTLSYIYMRDQYVAHGRVQNISLQNAINDFLVQCRAIIRYNSPVYQNDDGSDIPSDYTCPFGPEVMNSDVVMNMLVNSITINDQIQTAETRILDYITSENTRIQKNITIIWSVLIVGIVILIIISIVVEISWKRHDKFEIYESLTHLPKNIVSDITEGFSNMVQQDVTSDVTPLTHDSNSSTMNKQEDNFIRILATGSNQGNFFESVWLLIMSSIVTMACEIGVIYLIGNMFKNESLAMKHNFPNLIYLQSTYSMYIGAEYAYIAFVASKESTYTLKVDSRALSRLMAERSTQGDYNYIRGRYGGPSSDEIPFYGFESGVRLNLLQNCADPLAPPKVWNDIVKCYSADIIPMILYPTLSGSISAYRNGLVDDVDVNYLRNSTQNLWSILNFPIYDGFLQPMFTTIVPTIRQEMEKTKTKDLPLIITLILISVVFEVLALIQFNMARIHLKKVLMLLMHCPPEIVFQVPQIMKILSGNFKRGKIGIVEIQNSQLFTEIVENLPDIVIIANSNNIITRVNKSSSRVLKLDDKDLIGQNFKNFILNNFKGETDKLFAHEHPVFQFDNTITEDVAVENEVANASPQLNLTFFRKSDNTEIYLDVYKSTFNGNTFISARDATQTYRYNTLMKEEKQKTDNLLQSILPRTLVKRVQNGEKNISFAVQSATICFLDIVEFTPWCGSLPAYKVMKTLNLLFIKLDACLQTFPTMTKIKCIGDCYMAAGGVFDEINKPSQHAKEVVSFGLDAIDSVQVINEEIGENLRIRVGVNTGGPIVAGVLGSGKPTFEILGPAINLAQQMEHHGVPMQVHVSRSVYELIYGEQFIIKERGTVEVKNGTVVTYLVSRKT